MVKLRTTKIFSESVNLLGEVDRSGGDYLSIEEVALFSKYLNYLVFQFKKSCPLTQNSQGLINILDMTDEALMMKKIIRLSKIK
jgi:hypothetical protein